MGGRDGDGNAELENGREGYEECRTPHGFESTRDTRPCGSNACGSRRPERLGRRLSSQLQDPASRLDALAASSSESVRRCDPGIQLALKELTHRSPDTTPSEARRVIKEGSTAIVAGLDAAESLRNGVADKGGLTKEFRRVSRPIVGALGVLIDVKKVAQGWILRVQESENTRAANGNASTDANCRRSYPTEFLVLLAGSARGSASCDTPLGSSSAAPDP